MPLLLVTRSIRPIHLVAVISGLIMVLGMSVNASAHPGGTDASGGHTCYSNCAAYGLSPGQYHNHGSGGGSGGSGSTVPSDGSSSTMPSSGSGSTSSSDLTLAPLTPRGVSGVAGDGQAVVSWEVPLHDGGAPITAYTVTADPYGATCTWSSGPLQCTVTGLRNGTRYTFTVTATNAGGKTSDPSYSSVTLTPKAPASLPGKPTRAAAKADGGQVTVTWKAPSNTGGAKIVEYTVTSLPKGSKCTWKRGPLKCVVKGLKSGVRYTFTVAAKNAVGTGEASAPSNRVTPSTT